MFERLLNLDVEMRCLATKAFVKKEEIVDKVFYHEKKKKKEDSKEEVEKEEKDPKQEVKESFSELSKLLDELLELDEAEEVYAQLSENFGDSIEEFKEFIDKVKNKKEVPAVVEETTTEEVIIDVQDPQPVEEPNIIIKEKKEGMDFSALQEGVTYTNGPTPGKVLSQNPNLKQVTEETLEVALEKANKKK